MSNQKISSIQNVERPDRYKLTIFVARHVPVKNRQGIDLRRLSIAQMLCLLKVNGLYDRFWAEYD